jgi:hypothetical protein
MRKRLAMKIAYFIFLSILVLSKAPLSATRSAFGAQLTEAVLAASLASCNSSAETDQKKLATYQAIHAFVRTAYTTTFLINHRHTYPGIKLVMGLLGLHDATQFAAAYSKLFIQPQQNTPEADNNTLCPEESASFWSPETLALAQKTELCCALMLTLCPSHKALAVRCEYALCFAMLCARGISLSQQYQTNSASSIAILTILSLMLLDFVTPGSPFNRMANNRDQEFEQYQNLQPELIKKLHALDAMQQEIGKQLDSKLTQQERQDYAALAREIKEKRTNTKNLVCSTDVSLGDVQTTLADLEEFFGYQNQQRR